MKKLLIIGMCLNLHVSAGAATEYLRFEGSIIAHYWPGFNDLYDLDFEPSQSIWFDFEIDTELDRDGVPDDENVDYFQSTLVGGTLGVGDTSFGASGRVIEYLFGFLTVNNTLQVVSPLSACDQDPPPTGCSLAEPIPPFDWAVGTNFGLYPAWDFQEIFGNVTLTYRDSQPPPPIPLPGAAWLMLSALFAVGWLRKRIGSGYLEMPLSR